MLISYIKNIILSFMLFTTACCYGKDSQTVLVSVAPHKYFVEHIAGDSIKVELMVPAGASSHTFEPSPKQMMSASRADIWFQIGESFEDRAGKALKSHNPDLQFVDLRRGLDLIYCHPGDEGYCSCCHKAHANSADPHFWLSTRQAKIQANTIAEALSKRYPQHQQLFAKNLQQFHADLDALDQELSSLLSKANSRVIMVSHPAYAYFCRDYKLRQLSIEFEGKDPTPHQLTKILQQARDNRIGTVFIQLQYNNKGARLVADTIGAKIVVLDPYSENYMEAMKDIAVHFAEALSNQSKAS